MKKVLAILAAVGMLFIFTACGEDAEETSGGVLGDISDWLESDDFDEKSDNASDDLTDLLPESMQ